MKVYKYPLDYRNVESFLGDNAAEWKQQQIIELPAFSKILRVDKQGDDVVLWAKVDTDTNSKHKVGIEIVGTGHEIMNDDAEYVNTFFDGGLVMHVFVSYGIFSTCNEKV